MQIQIKSHDVRITAHEQEKLGHVLEHLERLVADYPAPHVHLDVQRLGHGQTGTEVRVRMTLALSRRRVVADHRAATVVAAAQICVDALARKIELARERVHRRHGERRIRDAKEHATTVDEEALRAAVAANDYARFRDALHEAPEAIEAEIARRLKFHPEADALLGDAYVLADLVEAVLARAFEDFAARPAGSLREWLVESIDPVLEAMAAAHR